MKTIKFSLKIMAINSYIYSGYLFLVLKDSRIVYIPISTVIRKLVDKYPSFENLIRISFQRNDYLSNKQGEIILGVGEMKTVFSNLWSRAASEIDFEIDFDEFEDKDYEILSECPSMPVLDMKFYAMRMYLGCKSGLYETNLNPDKNKYYINPSQPEKRFDAKVTHLNAKSGEVIISANNDGLFHGSFLNSDNILKVNSSPVSTKSIRTGWSNYDIVNYERQYDFQYFVNRTASFDLKSKTYSKFDEHREIRRISEFGIFRFEMSHLLKNTKLKQDEISYCFNSSTTGFFFTKNGKFVNINLNKDNKEDLYFTSRIHSLPSFDGSIYSLSRPISSSIVPKGCVVEYFDKVVLYQNAKAKIIETSPSINIRTYPNSLRYRNLITVTKESEITIHSIYPFDENPIKQTFEDLGDYDNSFDT